jgi:hypothetical protein
VGGAEIYSARAAQMTVPDGRCVALHCRVEGTHLLTFHLFGLLKQHFRCCQLHNNKEVEVAIRA